MKKSVLCLLLSVALASTFVFAQEQEKVETPKEDVMPQVSMLITGGLFKNQMMIMDLSKNLTTNQKYMLYSSNQKTSGGALALNLLVGFGVGSYIQGDTTGGTIGLIFDILSYGVVCLGATGSGETVAVGLLTKGISTIFQCIRAPLYAKKFNNALKQSLNLNSIAFDVVPVLSTDNSTEIAMACKIQF